ncbi:DNA recombination protein RmuC [Leucobacter allii]|uniref:DNA recombination protein RmuC n=1 Tax=Leucobacter allii TaxID=2932247 RepID=UPI001FD1DB75|nr:DNA recombination protein RmuC [Leucobacter allii]UOR00689.1 DNA recombination protein RmuC [Leucobacter allii]
MNALIVILLVANLLLLVAVLLVLLLRRPPTADARSGDAELRGLSGEIRQDLSAQRTELGQSLAGMAERVHAGAQATLRSQHELRGTVDARFAELAQANLMKQTELQQVLRQELETLRRGNEAKLEQMRETVDEKLQGTLERRLGESFRLVSDRLEQVQKGLGEMQTLASDVGGLKRVLTNVKNRGSWGEVQLARQLEDMLSPEQYAENVAVRPGSAERVEFAVRLPGRGDGDAPVWLPIDSKFPQEDYERLLEAQEGGERDEIEAVAKAVERVIVAQAKLIRDKYIEPPHSTDFAIMYLPTEGLFAEVIRRPGLTSRLQREFHVTVAGPTVLMSLLNSLQLGFRTLAIERRSSEVWQVLSAAKQEFQKYGQVWEKIGKQLTTVQNTVSEAGRRTRAVERRLRSVESLEGGEPTGLGDGRGEGAIDQDVDPAADTEYADPAGDGRSPVAGGGRGTGRDVFDALLPQAAREPDPRAVARARAADSASGLGALWEE